jgi:hypothetical protein
VSSCRGRRGLFFGLTAVQMRIPREEIETRTRTRVGPWLKDHVRPGQRVSLEPLGYIGSFGQARMADGPGLVCPEVVRLRRGEKCDFISIVARLKPEGIVLRRGGEVAALTGSKYFLENFAPVATFDARPRLERYRGVPGKSYLENDSVFRGRAPPRRPKP